MKTKGLTLLEIMIVVAIIGLVAAIAIPAATRLAEDVKADICRTNLSTIDKSKIQWAFDNNKSDTDEPTADDLEGYITGNVPKECVVAGALYDLGNVITPALCSYHGNGFGSGAGITVPDGLAELVKKGDISVSDLMDGDWNWHVGPVDPGANGKEIIPVGLSNRPGEDYVFTKYKLATRDVTKETEITSLAVESSPMQSTICRLDKAKNCEMASKPKLEINGNVITGDGIRHFSKEYVDLNKSYWEQNSSSAGAKEAIRVMQQMDKGGYEVVVYNESPSYSYTYYYSYYDSKGASIGSVSKTQRFMIY